MLCVEKINVYYGKVQALYDASLQIGKNEIVSIIGANGAGKSPMIRSIMGLTHVSSGAIQFRGQNITKLSTHNRTRQRITCVPEGRHVFPGLSVRDNLEMGAFSRRLNRAALKEEIDKVYAIFPRLKEREKQAGGTLSGGEQQMLAIGRGLMNAPSLLLLDEPSLGLAPIIVDEMFDIIRNINQVQGIPILLVEQNAFHALEVSHHAYVLENGHIVSSGESSKLLYDPDIIKAYLGG